MRVGTIKETRTEEYRVGLTPSGVGALVSAGHEAYVERGAGIGSGFPDEAYTEAGAKLAATAAEVADAVRLLVKVKELTAAEYPLLRPGLTIFAYLALPYEPEFTHALLETRATAIAYESVQLADGTRPLLAPMSRIAGRMAAEIAAQYLKKPGPGRGKLLGGIPHTSPARAVVIGSGAVGSAAAEVLAALGADVTVIARDEKRLAALKAGMRDPVRTRTTSPGAIAEVLAGADVLIGGVRVTGPAPKLITREMVRSMGEGAVFVDVGMDQGGISETSQLTDHGHPTYVEEGVIHYCVPNMPGAVPRTSTEGLTTATLPYVLKLAARGVDALREDPALATGVEVFEGKLTSQAVAETLGLEYTPLAQAIGSA